MRRCRSHSNRRQYSRARSHSSHRTRPSGARHEHRRGAGLRHTGRVSVPAGTIVWLSAVRSRQSWPLSRLPNPARILQVPQNIRIVPVNAVGSVRSGHSGVRMDRNRGNPRPSSGCCFHPTAAPATRSTGRHRGSKRRHAHRRDGTPASLTQSRAPSMRFLSPPWCTKLPLGRPNRSTLAGTSLPLRTPFAHAVRLIQKSHPAILAVTGSDHSPVAFYFRNGWLFSPEYAPVLRAVVQHALSRLPVHAADRVERSDQGGG